MSWKCYAADFASCAQSGEVTFCCKASETESADENALNLPASVKVERTAAGYLFTATVKNSEQELCGKTVRAVGVLALKEGGQCKTAAICRSERGILVPPSENEDFTLELKFGVTLKEEEVLNNELV